jgi:hypothetical protein
MVRFIPILTGGFTVCVPLLFILRTGSGRLGAMLIIVACLVDCRNTAADHRRLFKFG